MDDKETLPPDEEENPPGNGEDPPPKDDRESLPLDAEEVRKRWAERSKAYSPEYYAYYGPDERSELVRKQVDAFVGPDATILELGCGSGRHLAHLREHGYRNLSGVDINPEAPAVMAEAYPDLAEAGTIYVDAIEDVVTEFEDGQFDVVYSVETLQHIHPDDQWVFAELSRLTDDLLLTVENEAPTEQREDEQAVDDERATRENPGKPGETRTATDTQVTNVDGIPLYHRNWRRVFTGLGFVEVRSERIQRDVCRAFRPP